MSAIALVVLAGSGLAGFASGFLGLGGAILLIPSLLIGPALIGVAPLSIHEASGLTAASVAATSFVAVIAHRSSGFVDSRLVATTGLAMAVAGFAGAGASGSISPLGLLAVFATMATVAAGLLLVRYSEERDGGPVCRSVEAEFAVGTSVGFAAGMVGAGGAFLLVPAISRLARIPLRVAVGTMPAVALVGTLGSLGGKVVAGQVPLDLLPWSLAASLPAAAVGAWASHRATVTSLRYVLGILATVIAVCSWLGVAQGVLAP